MNEKKTYWLEFSPFEQHLYERVLEAFREERRVTYANSEMNTATSIMRSCGENVRLDELDRNKLATLLSPLLDIRLTCNHPQLILTRRSFHGLARPGAGTASATGGDESPNQPSSNTVAKAKKDKLLTMEQSVQMLLDKTQSECEHTFRTSTAHSIAIAGLCLLKGERARAIRIYQSVLDAERTHHNNVHLSRAHRIHTLHNYLQLTAQQQQQADDTLSMMRDQLMADERAFTLAVDEAKRRSERELRKKMSDAGSSLAHLAGGEDVERVAVSWALGVIEQVASSSPDLRAEFWEKLSTSELAHQFCGRTVRTFDELRACVRAELSGLLRTRERLFRLLELFFADDNEYKKHKKDNDARYFILTF